MNRLKVILAILFLAILGPRIYMFIRLLDIGETVFPHTPGPCSIVKGSEKKGSEDIHVIPGTDIAIISSGMRWGKGGNREFSDRKGNLMFFDFNKPGDGAIVGKIKGFPATSNLNPHGISVWAEKGKVIVLVISHDKVDVVERFEVDVKTYTLTYLESITDPDGFASLNDLVATGERTFYFSIYQNSRPESIMGQVETFAQLRYGALGYYDGTKTHILDSGLLLPNGINLSPDNKYLYLVHIGDDEIRTYEIKSPTDLKLVQQKKVETLVDNISVDPVTGDLWLGCHPVGWKILYHLEHPTATAPSQVIRITTEKGLPTDDTREVYVDSGNTISASTVAVYHKSQLLIGSIYHNTVYCKVNAF